VAISLFLSASAGDVTPAFSKGSPRAFAHRTSAVVRCRSIIFEKGIFIMKNALVCFVLAASTLAAPVLSFAQSNAPLTRAEVRADLIRVEQAGYSPSLGDDATYPAAIQAAEAKVAAQNAAPATQITQSTQSAYGGVTSNGHSQSGARSHMPTDASCVGPVSFCNPFFGS
jgi:hypothetical protein